MDPVSQGILGAALPLTIAREKEVKLAGLSGCIAGMAPDLDILIRSSADPLLAIEYHRHFTHSLLFVPIGSLVVTLFLWPLLRRRLSFARSWLFTTLGYLTHAPLDACTSYGTRLLWPFSDMRVAWDVIAVVDPLFTLPLGILVGLALFRKKPNYARAAMVFACSLLLFGLYQRNSAASAMRAIVDARGHQPDKIVTKPSIANLVLWRSIYEWEGRYYVDGIYIGFFSRPVHYEGTNLPGFDPTKTYPDLDRTTTLYKDIERFSHFSSDYVALHPTRKNFLGDIRYALLPNSVEPLWGIVIDDTQPNDHVVFENLREVTDDKKSAFWNMLWGKPISQSNP